MKQKKNLKFKIQYVPLADDRVNRHKDFDGLMAAYTVAPKPNVFQRWMNSRYFLFGSGLVVGLTFSGLMLLKNFTNDVQTVVTNKQQTTQQELQQPSSNNATSNQSQPETKPTQPSTTITSNDVAGTNSSSMTTNSNTQDAVTTTHQSVSKDVATKAFDKSSGSRVNDQSYATNKTSKSRNSKSLKQSQEVKNDAAKQSIATTDNTTSTSASADRKSNNKTNSTLAKTNEVVGSDSTNDATVINRNSEAVNVDNNGIETSTNNPSSRSGTEAIVEQQTVNSKSDNIAQEETETAKPDTTTVEKAVATNNTIDSATDSATQITANTTADSTNVAVNTTTQNASVVQTDSSTVSQQASADDKAKKSLFSGLFAKKDSTDNAATTKEKKHKLFGNGPETTKALADEDTSFINHYAQVSFVTPLSSNGTQGSKYKHYFSLNVLQGNTGALEGVEFGGLANIEKGYVRGAQFGGLVNLVGGSVKGAQFGGLANTSRSLTGAQFGGVANVNMHGGAGFQAGGVANVNAGGQPFVGWQIAGVANYTYGNLKGVQISGAANLNTTRIDGGQISGAFNIANESNGFQIGVINFARKMKGFQIGVINVADTMQGGGIGLINVSRNGQFSVDVWSSDYFQVNGGLKIGSKTVYNEYAFGISPFGQSNAATDTINGVSNPLPFGFGLGIGGHIPIGKAFINVDGMCWTVHDRYLSFNGVNLLNQLRVLGGYNVNKYFGLYAGPVFNVSVQDVAYAPLKKNVILDEGSANTRVRGWIGFSAGIQLF